MSAFKAANPDAVFEDFIRWHSPGDWEEDDLDVSMPQSGIGIEKSKDIWPPRGRLSKRMSEQGNLWRQIWDSASALSASEQKPLLDPSREGEKVRLFHEMDILLFMLLFCSSEADFCSRTGNLFSSEENTYIYNRGNDRLTKQ